MIWVLKFMLGVLSVAWQLSKWSRQKITKDWRPLTLTWSFQNASAGEGARKLLHPSLEYCTVGLAPSEFQTSVGFVEPGRHATGRPHIGDWMWLEWEEKLPSVDNWDLGPTILWLREEWLTVAIGEWVIWGNYIININKPISRQTHIEDSYIWGMCAMHSSLSCIPGITRCAGSGHSLSGVFRGDVAFQWIQWCKPQRKQWQLVVSTG